MEEYELDEKKVKRARIIGILSWVLIVVLAIGYLGVVYLPVTGTYVFDEMVMSNGMILEAGDEYFGMSITEDYLVLTLNKETFTMEQGNSRVNGVWKKNGNDLVLTLQNGMRINAKRNLYKITLSIDRNQYTLIKPLFGY